MMRQDELLKSLRLPLARVVLISSVCKVKIENSFCHRAERMQTLYGSAKTCAIANCFRNSCYVLFL